MGIYIAGYVALAFLTYGIWCRYFSNDQDDMALVIVCFFLWPLAWIIAVISIVLYIVFYILDRFEKLCRKGIKK